MPKIKPEELKASILQYAIEGRLVEQRAEEGTAEELYKQIQAEKQKRIRDGKIKKEKPLAEITDENTPFEIPASWKWVYSRDVIRFINGRAYKKPELLSKGKYPVLRVGNFFTNESWYYSDLELDDDKYCQNGDLLYAWSASFGPKIWDGEKVIYHYHIWKLDYFQPMYIKYLYYYLLADTIRIKNSSHGLGFVFVTKEFMEERMIPLPPLAEQRRIVAKIEELLPYVDRYAEAYEKLEEFNDKFPDEMKKSILQYAIEGRLVEQRAEEGTAEELYKQIQAEKQILIKEGKIKKEKPLPEISEKEIPFDIPESWKWCRIGDIFSLTMGQSPDGRSVSKNGDGIEFHQGKIFFGENYIQKSDQTTSEPSKIAEANSVLLCVRAPVGIVNITDRDLCIGRGLCSIMPLSDMTSKFTLYFIRCLENDFIKKATGTTFVAITGEVVKNQLIPLPPLAEQRRIVAKIEELLPLCERLAECREKA